MPIKAETNIAVYFKNKAWQKFRIFIENVPMEVGGYGKVRFDYKTGQIVVEDVYLVEQEVTGSSTDLSAEGMSRFYKERLDKDPDDDLSSYKLWWHSHANMGVFWSKTDTDTMESFDMEVDDPRNWMLSIVGNHAGDIRARIDHFHPYRYNLDDLPVAIEAFSVTHERHCLKEIEKKVVEKTFTAKPDRKKNITVNGESVIVNHKSVSGYDVSKKGEVYVAKEKRDVLELSPDEIVEEILADVEKDVEASEDFELDLPLLDVKSIVNRAARMAGQRLSKKQRKRLKKGIHRIKREARAN